MMMRERVIVVKDMPRLGLHEGDILVVSKEGNDFELEQAFEDLGDDYFKTTNYFTSVDYITVSENIPEYFDLITEEDYEVELRSVKEIEDRIEYFQKRFDEYIKAPDRDFTYDEPLVIWRNLIWNLEWVLGHRDLYDISGPTIRMFY